MLESETRSPLPPVPPWQPQAPKKRQVAIIVAVIATGILVVGSLMLFVGTARDAKPEVAADAVAVESEIEPSPTVVTTPTIGTSPSPVSDRSRILAIVADAHSGKYFSNRFRDTYPKAAVIGMVSGMARSTDGDPKVSDVLLACSLSYIETHLSFTELMTKDPKSTQRIGVKAGFACIDYLNL